MSQAQKLRNALKHFRQVTGFKSYKTYSDKFSNTRRISMLCSKIDSPSKYTTELERILKEYGVEYERVEYIQNFNFQAWGTMSYQPKIAIYRKM